MSASLDQVVAVLRHALQAAAEVTLPLWRSGLAVERKADRSPVTEADRAAERVISDIITAAFPDHGVLGEEGGARAGDGRHRWIIDPIDGTRGFTRGGRFWGSLVGLEVDGEIVAGGLCMPVLDDLWWAARGRGCHNGDERVELGPRATRWGDATLSLGELEKLLAPPWGAALTELVISAENARCYGDLRGITLVLEGVADLWIEAGVQPWDLAPVRVLIEEAGGVYSDFAGGVSLSHGTAIAGPAALHAIALERLRSSQGFGAPRGGPPDGRAR